MIKRRAVITIFQPPPGLRWGSRPCTNVGQVVALTGLARQRVVASTAYIGTKLRNRALARMPIPPLL